MALTSLASQDVARSADDRVILGFFLVQVVAMTLLQKIAFPPSVQLCLPIILGSLIVMIPMGRVGFDPLRFLLLALFLTSALISQILSGKPFSSQSFFLAIVLYVPMCLVIPVDRATFLKCLDMFQWAMLAVLVIVLIEHALQVTVGWRAWPNLDKVVPYSFLVPSYNYLQPLHYGSNIYKPNAIVFLETSFVSQFAAIAFIIEAVFFKRLAQLAAFSALLLLTFAGTGLLMLVITAPFLLLKAGLKATVAAVFGVVILGAVATATGYVDTVGDRVFEFQQPGTSGYFRFASPFITLMERASDPTSLMTGIGAGNTLKTSDVPLAPVKIATEYGFVPMFLFFAFMLVAMIRGQPSGRMCVGFLAYYLLGGGGFAVPVYVLMVVLFCTLLRIKPDAEPNESHVLRPIDGSLMPSRF